MLFFIIAGSVTLAVLGVLLAPLLRTLERPGDPLVFNAAIYRDQLSELERDDGGLTEGDSAAAKVELQRRLSGALKHAQSSSIKEITPPAYRLALLLSAAFLLGGGALYLLLGSPDIPDQPQTRLAPPGPVEQQAASKEPMDNSKAPHPEMEAMVAKLSERLRTKPDDPQGWALLARSLMNLNRPAEAADAFQTALDRSGGGDPQLQIDYAEARVIAAGGVVDQKAGALFLETLKAEPGNPEARFYLAQVKLQDGDSDGALLDLQSLVADSPKDAPWLETVNRRIAEIAPAAAPVSSPSGGPTADQLAAGANLSAADRDAMVDGMVERLADHLKTQPNDLDGWRRLARAYQVLGDRLKAHQADQQILRLRPGDAQALKSEHAGG